MNKFNTWAEETDVWLEESIPVKRFFIPLPAMNHGIVESKEKRELRMHLLDSANDYIKIMRYV